MPKKTVLLAVLLLLVSKANTAPRRDQTAVQVLRQAVTRLGWSPATLPTDVRATGQITLYAKDGGAQESGSIQYRGVRNLGTAIETNNGGQTVTAIYAGAKAVRIEGTGKMFFASRSGPGVALPFFADFWGFETNGQWSISDRGITTVGGEQLYAITVWKELPSDDQKRAEVRKGSEVTLWISSTTLLPVQVEYQRGSFENSLAYSKRIRQFSDYRLVQGRMVPFRQEEFAFGKKISTVQLQEVIFDSGLSRSEFQIGGAE